MRKVSGSIAKLGCNAYLLMRLAKGVVELDWPVDLQGLYEKTVLLAPDSEMTLINLIHSYKSKVFE